NVTGVQTCALPIWGGELGALGSETVEEGELAGGHPVRGEALTGGEIAHRLRAGRGEVVGRVDLGRGVRFGESERVAGGDLGEVLPQPLPVGELGGVMGTHCA